jgi:hypothetical protein
MSTFGLRCMKEVLVHALGSFPHNRDLVLNVCGACALLVTYDVETKLRFCQCGGVETLMRSASNFANDAAVTAVVCLLVEHLARVPLNRNRLVTCGACEYVVNACKNFSDNVTVVEPACQSIAHLADGDADVTRRFGSLHACEIVVSVLENVGGDDDVAEAVCFALYHLAHDADNKNTLVICGAKDAVEGAVSNAMSAKVYSKLLGGESDDVKIVGSGKRKGKGEGSF